MTKGPVSVCARVVYSLLLINFLAACDATDSAATAVAGRETQEIETAAVTAQAIVEPIPLANECVNFSVDQQYLVIDPKSGFYSLDSNRQQALSVFLKPSGLDNYLLYDSESKLLAAEDELLRTQALDERLQWNFISVATDVYVLRSDFNGKYLVAQGAALQLIDNFDAASEFVITPASGCALFPEATTNSEGMPSISEFSDGAVWGIADVHAHLFGTLAFAGNIMAGDVFHPLGIEKALEDCSNQHGIGGRTDLTGFITNGEGSEEEQIGKLAFKLLFHQPLHNTDGYPDFTEWPNPNTTTHQISYYKWLERAYLGGLRLMVNLLVESGPLCKVGRELSKSYAPTDADYEFDPDVLCNGSATSEKQLAATHALVDYIDAQAGGSGKGWLRLVNTPQEAREVIKNKKLAMIIGSETPDLFGCIDGVEGGRAQCTTNYIDEKLDEYQAKGINTVFPVHHYDNDFGGALVFNPIIEVASVVQDGALFHYEACEAQDYDPLLAIKLPVIYYRLFPNFMRDLALFPFVPEAEGYCNRVGLTTLGGYLIRAMMTRGMLIETAHMSPKMKQAVVEMAEYYDYPLIDTHMGKAFLDSQKPEEARYLSLGGVRAPLFNRTVIVDEYGGVRKSCASHTSQDIAIQLMAFSDTREALGLEPGVVFGTDMHGMVQQSMPRFGGAAACYEPQQNPLTYPFFSFDGSVMFEKQITGNRIFDFNTDGLAHVGMLPDLIQDMRNQGMSDEYLTRFFRGAESYLQVWEKAIARSQSLADQGI